MKRTAFYLALASYTAAILFASARKIPVPMAGVAGIDKLYHAAVYLILGALWTRAVRLSFSKGRFDGARGHLAVIAIGFAITFSYGLLMELMQYYIPEREAELLDSLSNGAGGLAGSVIYEYIIRRYDRWVKVAS